MIGSWISVKLTGLIYKNISPSPLPYFLFILGNDFSFYFPPCSAKACTDFTNRKEKKNLSICFLAPA